MALLYVISILIGLLIGMEVPLVIRINNEFENLRFNISNILENDYYGSLLGGVFFAFIVLPMLGLVYTPFVLGIVNFLVAVLLIVILWSNFTKKQQKRLIPLATLVLICIAAGSVAAKPVILYGEQAKYQDKVVFTKQSQYQRIVLTQWKNDYWLYLNGNQQLYT